MKNFVIIDGTGYKVIDNKAYEISWDFETGIMTVSDEESEITIPSEKYTYNEMYKKLNVSYYTNYYEGTQLETDVTVTPKKTAQNIKPSKGYDGLASVSVSAVTSDIDDNIVAENIKNGVTILGVTGTYTGETTPETPSQEGE